MDRIDPAEPMLPIEATDPMLPMHSTEPRDPIDSSESVDHSDKREGPVDVISTSSRQAAAARESPRRLRESRRSRASSIANTVAQIDR